MLAELTQEFRSAAGVAVVGCPVGAVPALVWGVSIKEVLQKVLEKAIELGREYRPDIEAAAKSAVDAIVAMDLPGVPDLAEQFIDEATRKLGYMAIESVLNAIFAEQVIGA
jgi:hypothetical protein